VISGDTGKRFQFYGRRKGKSLRRHHSALMEQLLPRLQVDLADPLSGMGERRWLEIGFGGGEHLAAQAARHPETLMIGCEPFLNGVASALRHIEEGGLKNVRLHADDAVDHVRGRGDVVNVARIHVALQNRGIH
jgi:tRNA (guanine-N7-)-methyltransferase